jgi:hypothetical protein
LAREAAEEEEVEVEVEAEGLELRAAQLQGERLQALVHPAERPPGLPATRL